MRLNKYIALHTGVSRRRADQLIKNGEVLINDEPAQIGKEVSIKDKITVSGLEIKASYKITTIMLNKPVGYVVSRNGQGSKTVYDLLPKEFHNLKPIGRLDKDSSGLILLTNDGDLANKLTHPSHRKEKVYEVDLDKSLTPEDKTRIETGVLLEDGKSSLKLKVLRDKIYEVRISEGRNRQIRRTFAALDYKVTKLHRTGFGEYNFKDLQIGNWKNI